MSDIPIETEEEIQARLHERLNKLQLAKQFRTLSLENRITLLELENKRLVEKLDYLEKELAAFIAAVELIVESGS